MSEQSLDEGDDEQSDDERDQQAEEKWIRVHPADRLWLDGEMLRLQRERFEETRVLERPGLQDTVASVFEEVRDSRARIRELEDEVDALHARLESCVCGADVPTSGLGRASSTQRDEEATGVKQS